MEYGGTWFGVLVLAAVGALVWVVARQRRRTGRKGAVARWAEAYPRASVIIGTILAFGYFFAASTLAFDDEPGEAFELALPFAVGWFIVESIALARREDEGQPEPPDS